MRLPRSGSIAHNSLQTMIVYALRLGIQLALLLLVARFLNPAEYGEFAGIAALAFGLGTLSSFGLGFLVLGESARDPAAGHAVFAEAIPMTLLSAMLLMPLYFWLSFYVIGSSANMLSVALIGLAELLFAPLLGLASFRLQGLGHIARSQSLALLPMLLRLIGVAACIVLLPDSGLFAYALVHGLGSAAGLGLGLWFAWRAMSPLEGVAWPKFKTLRRGASFAVMNFMAINPSELDKALALRLLGANETGLYALASRGMAIVTLPVVAMTLAAQPRIFRESHDSRTGPGSVIATVMGASLVYGLVAAVLIYVTGPLALEFLLGERYQGIGEVVRMIAFIAPFMTTRFAGGGILLALGRPLLRAGFEVVGLLMLIVITLILAPRNGIQGLIMAVGASEALMAILSGVFLLRRFRRVPIITGGRAGSGCDADPGKHPT
ncbi:lipopolysaccharide biosynthesis protein [Rhodocyclaceae bacterium SMB388]